MKKTYRTHDSSIFNKDANIIAILVYVPSYIVLILAGALRLPEFVVFFVGLLPLLLLLKEKSPLIRFHCTSAAVITSGLVLFINLFYLMLLGYQVHNTEWGSLIYGYLDYFVILGLYFLPAYCMVNAYKYKTVNIPLHNKAVAFLSKYEDYDGKMVIKGKKK